MNRTCFFVVLGALGAAAAGDVVEISPARDNSIFSEGDLSNALGQRLFAGMTAQFHLRRALIMFDVAGAVPAGSTINFATLHMNCSRQLQPAAVSLHRLRASWGEGTSRALFEEGMGAPATPGDATWMARFFPGDPWGIPGGDFVDSPSATSLSPGSGPVTWATGQMALDVQSWLDSPAENHGWILIGEESVFASAQRFDSRENVNPAVRPRLVLDFTPPCAADFNGDGQVDFFDYLDFVQAFNDEDPSADFNGDGQVDFFDYLDFVQAFDAGCD